jgi:hypothetical protein
LARTDATRIADQLFELLSLEAFSEAHAAKTSAGPT